MSFWPGATSASESTATSRGFEARSQTSLYKIYLSTHVFQGKKKTTLRTSHDRVKILIQAATRWQHHHCQVDIGPTALSPPCRRQSTLRCLKFKDQSLQPTSVALVSNSFLLLLVRHLLLEAMHLFLLASLLLVAMQGAPISVLLFLLAMASENKVFLTVVLSVSL